MANGFYINAARRDVGGDENPMLAALETVE